MMPSEILRLETIALNAWMPLQVLLHDGWLHGVSGGFTGRGNSVYPLQAGTQPLTEKLAYAEALYDRCGLAPQFKLTRAAQPASLEVLLDERGYGRSVDTLVCTMPLSVPEYVPAVEVYTTFDEAWFQGMLRCSARVQQYESYARQMYARILPTSGFCLVRQQGEPVAVAVITLELPWAGLFSVNVRSDQRGLGLGRQITHGALAWAAAAGATTAYLQVEEDNPVARHIYESLGFTAQYRYWYRTHP